MVTTAVLVPADVGLVVPGPFGTLQPVTSRQVFPEQNLSDGSVQTLTYRSRHVFEEDTPFVILVYANSAEPAGYAVDTVTYKAGYDYVPAASVGGSLNSIACYGVTFRGAASMSLLPGSFGASDPIFGPFKKGDVLLVRTNVAVDTLGKKWPIGMTLNWGYEGTASGDQTTTPNFSISFTPAGSGVSPTAILGPVNGRPCVVALGDSIPDGAGDTGTGSEPTNNNGFISRACWGKYGLVKLCFPGRRVAQEVASAAYRQRGPLAMLGKNAICEYATNDIGNGDSLATIQANLIAFWNLYSNTGRRLFQTTIVPRTTSTDSWATVANQTVRSGESVRLALNTWLRAGAPMAAGVAVAVGTAGALVAGNAGHPLCAIFDVAAAVEVNASNVLTLNGGFWITTGAANYPTADGIHPSRATSILMSAAVDDTKFTA